MLFKCQNKCRTWVSDYSTNAFKKDHYCSDNCKQEHMEMFN